MEIEFSQTQRDSQALARYHRKLRGVRTHLLFTDVVGVTIIVVVIILGLGFVVPFFLFESDGILGSWLGLSAGFFGGRLLSWFWQAGMSRAKHKASCEDPRSEWTIRDLRVALFLNHIRTHARGSTTLFEWSRVWHIGVTSTHAFFYLTRDAAIIIPRRAFRDDKHFDDFVALARQYQMERLQGETKSTGIIAALPPRTDALFLRD